MGNPRHVSAQQDKQIAKEFRAGIPTRKLAQRFNVDRSVIYAALRREHATAKEIGRSRLVPNAQQLTMRNREIIANYQSGSTIRQVAAHFGLRPTRTQKILDLAGVLVDRTQLPEEIKKELAQRWLNGESQASIGRALGISQSKAGRALHRLGYIPNNRNRGSQHGAWKGGKYLCAGYIRCFVNITDPMRAVADVSGYAMEHRLIMSRKLGRPLTRKETVHHINGNRQDNREDNLQLRNGRHGAGIVLHCLDCGSHNIASKPLGEISSGR